MWLTMMDVWRHGGPGEQPAISVALLCSALLVCIVESMTIVSILHF
jgi:hypothetical protein